MIDESVSASLRRLIAERDRAGFRLGELSISDDAAMDLAGELYEMQMIPASTIGQIYDGLKTGNSRFMGCKLTVASP